MGFIKQPKADTPKPTGPLPSVVGQLVENLQDFAFNTITVGDTFTTKGIFRGVSDTPLEWRLIECNFSKSTLRFDISYHGILLHEVSMYPNENYRVQAR